MGAMEIFSVVGRIAYEGGQAVESGLQSLQNQVEGVQGSFERFGERASAAGEKINGIGETLTTNVTAPLAALGAVGLLSAADFEEAGLKIQAQTGKTGEELAMMEDQAKSLWRNGFGENITAAGEALSVVSKNMVDMPIEQLEKAAEKAYILQDAFGMEIAESTAIADQMMLRFGLSADEAFDVLTTGYQNGLDYGADFADTVREYSPIFAEAGMSANDMLSFMETAQAAGFRNLDVAADTFKEFTLLSSEGSEEFAGAVALMGKETQALYKGFQEGKVSGQELFYGISSGLKNIEDPQKRFQAGVLTMGTMFEDNTENMVMNMTDMRTELETVVGATDDAGAALYDTFGAKLQGALRTFQDALLPIGMIIIETLEPAIAKFSSGMQKLADWFQTLSPQMQQGIVIFGMIAAAIGPILVVVGMLVSSVGAIATALAGVSAVAFGWIAVIALVVAAVVAAYFKFEEFRNGVNAVFSFIGQIITLVIGTVVAFVQAQLAQLQAFWAQHGSMIMQAVSNAFNFIKGIIDFVMPAILFIIQAVWNSIKGVVNGVLNFIMGLVLAFSGLLTGNFGAMWEGIKQMFFGALEAIWNYMNLMMIGRIITIIKNFAVGGFNLIVGFGKNIVNAFKSMWNSASSAVSSGVQAVIKFFQKLGSDAARIFSILRQTGDNIFNAIKNTITSIAQNIASKVGSVFTGMKNTVVNIFNNVKSSAQTAFNNIKSAIQNPIQTAVDFVRRQVDKIKGFFSGMNISLPKIKLPHFSLVGNFSLNPPSVPKLSVDWYAKGGVFDRASVIGVGEAGPEAVLPLLGEKMAPFAKAVSDNLQGMGTGGNLTVILEMDGYQLGKVLTPNVSMNQGNEVRIKTFMKGGQIG